MNAEYSYFITSYPVGDEEYQSHIFARSWEEAVQTAEVRGLGERILGIGEVAPHHPIPEDLASRAHYVCFLSMIALRAKTVNPDSVLGDRGLLHEIIHAICGVGDMDQSTFESQIRSLERLVPGYSPV